MRKDTETAAADTAWKSLYRIGGAAALIMIAITLSQVVVFLASPPPYEGTAADWFALFQKNALLGLLSFEVLLIVYVVLSTFVSLALFVVLRRTSPTLTAIFLALSLMGSVAFLSARPAFEMLSLSNQYAAATTDAQRAVFLAAGEAMVAVFRGTAYLASYLLGSISGLILGAVMLRNGIFGRAIPYLRIASGVLDLGMFIPTVGIFLSLISVLCLLFFNILAGRRLLRLGSGIPEKGPL
jgi:hypothetical protein